jgi:cell division protein FtsN
LRAELAKKGHNAKIIEPVTNTGIYKVTIDDYENVEEAKAALEKLKSQNSKDLWIFKY